MLTIEIKDSAIIITLPLDVIDVAFRGMQDINSWQDKWTISDIELAAKSIVLALKYEDEEGTTLVHKMFDQAFEEALESGGEGFGELK